MFVLLSSCLTFLQCLIRFNFVTEMYFVTQRTKQLCMQKSLWETQAQIVDLVRAVAYKIHKWIASSVVRSLTTYNRLTCRRLFLQKNSMCCSMAPSFGPTLQKSAHFFRLFLASARVALRYRGIELRGLLPPNPAVLRIPPKTDLSATILNHNMFAYILLRRKTILVLRWRHRPIRPILRYC